MKNQCKFGGGKKGSQNSTTTGFRRVWGSIWEGFGAVWADLWALLGDFWALFWFSKLNSFQAWVKDGVQKVFCMDFRWIFEASGRVLGRFWQGFG